jgi:crossover junction endodeoxyribonuclease RuvC
VTAQTIIGIDPGAHGAIAVMNEGGDLLEVLDMSSTPEANGRSATNAPLLAGILARVHAREAFCEFVGARPTDAKVAAFSFGRARGVIEGCAGALGLPIVFLTPPTWKRLADIPPGAENKDLARDARDRPLAGPRRSLCPQARCRPRRSMPDRVRWSHAGGAPWLTTSKLPSPPAPSSRFRRRAARQTELARLGTVEPDKTPGVFIRTGEAALADRLANAWAALAQELEDAP